MRIMRVLLVVLLLLVVALLYVAFNQAACGGFCPVLPN